MTIRIDFKRVYAYIIFFLFLYTSDSIYTYVYGEWDHEIEIIADIMMLMVAWRVNRNALRKIILPNINLWIVMMMLSILSAGKTEYLFLFALFLRMLSVSVFIVWCYCNQIDFIEILCNTIYAIAIVYLVCYVVFDLGLLNIKPERVIISGWSGSKSRQMTYGCYGGFYYRWDFSRRLLGFNVFACNGFFREVGVYQIFLNFALYWYMFVRKRNAIRCIVLTLAVITTFSTMGLVILAALLILKSINRSSFSIIVGSIVFIIISYSMYVILIEKFSLYAGSRMRNLDEAIQRIYAHPIVGNGYNRDYTTFYGLLNYFVNWGVLGFIPICVYIVGCIKKSMSNSWQSTTAIIIWWFCSLMDEAAGYNMLFLALYTICYISIRDNTNHLSYFDFKNVDSL